MSANLRRRLNAVEAKTGTASSRFVVRWKPTGMDDAASAAWYAAEIEPEERLGAHVTIYSFTPWPPESAEDIRDLIKSASVAKSLSELEAKVRVLPSYPQQASVLAELSRMMLV